jgi:predicted regulator of Ras-like GTPase activity (Roadblock/LC7/MglB family)
MSAVPVDPTSRASRLDRILNDLLRQTPGIEAAAVVSFDGLPMVSALPADMDEDRVAAMSAALLSLAERATQGLGRGALSQVYIEGENGTVFLVAAQDEGVLVAVTSAGAKVGMMLYEIRLAASQVADVLRTPAPPPAPPVETIRETLADYTMREYGVTVPAGSPPPTPSAGPPGGFPAVSGEPYQTAYAAATGEPSAAVAPTEQPAEPEPAPWSSYTPSGSVLPDRPGWG